MAVHWALICHGLITLTVVVSFLCGQWPIFQGTPISSIHRFITFGAYQYFLKLVGAVFGDKGTNLILSVEYYCCDRPNPILQIMYLAIIGATYYIIVKTSFRYIPGYYLSGVHRYTSLLAVAIGILLFLLTSFSDPGTVKAENVSQYLSAYPYDNIIYTEKECSTCKLPKPARSKHCSICNRCVARFDHHCGWMVWHLQLFFFFIILRVASCSMYSMLKISESYVYLRWCYLFQNNCIGERNTRYFLAFLLWHFLLCMYATIAIGLVLAGRFKELKVVYILTVYYGVENSFGSLAPHIVQWLLGSYDTQILLMLFMAIVSLLLAGFFAYHAKLCLTNTTTNETFKWQDYVSWQKQLSEARASTAALKVSINGMSREAKPPESKCKSFFRMSPLEEAEAVVNNNVYDKGFFHNFYEVIFPVSTRASFLPAKSKSG